MMLQKILRLPEVKKITGLSRSSIYRLGESNEFPKSIKIGPRAVGWLEAEVLAWLHQHIVLRNHSKTASEAHAEPNQSDEV